MVTSSEVADQGKSLSATYNSPTNQPFSFTEQLGPAPSTKVEDKSKYLNDLRKATSVLQEKVNKELTERMEEDNARAAELKNGKLPHKEVDEDKEEAYYGEEAAEEED